MAVFTDTITIYQKQTDGSWKRTVLEGVQWSDKLDKSLQTGRLTVAKSAIITIQGPALDQIDLSSFTEEDAIVYGNVTTEVTAERGHRISDLIKDNAKSGIIRTVNDNRGRDLLKNIKVVIY